MVLICMNMGLFPRRICNLVRTYGQDLRFLFRCYTALQMILQDLHAMRSEMVRGWVEQILADATTRYQSPDMQDGDI
jgi:hypothetical protein